MIKQCPKCGNDFNVYPSVEAQGKGKYCSRKCSDERNGSKIERNCVICKKVFIVAIHRTNDVMRGKYCSRPCYHKSRKGRPAWNIGKPATWAIGNKHRLGKTNTNPHKMFGEDNHKWKGDDVGYNGIHQWVKRILGKPTKCEICNTDGLSGKQIHWSSKSHKYLRDISDWQRLCVKCHADYDNKNTLRQRR